MTSFVSLTSPARDRKAGCLASSVYIVSEEKSVSPGFSRDFLDSPPRSLVPRTTVPTNLLVEGRRETKMLTD